MPEFEYRVRKTLPGTLGVIFEYVAGIEEAHVAAELHMSNRRLNEPPGRAAQVERRPRDSTELWEPVA